MPTDDIHLQLQKWALEYGDIYSLILGTQTLIVLSGDETVKDLLDKRSSNYSDRPEMYIAGVLGSDSLRLLTMVSDPTHDQSLADRLSHSARLMVLCGEALER